MSHVNTGSRTYFGKTTELVGIAKPKSHEEEVMMAIVRFPKRYAFRKFGVV